MSYRDPCRHCGQEILVARVRGGRWLPFEIETYPAELGTLDAWIPSHSRGFVPVSEVAERHLANHRRYARQHRCPQFLRWLAESRDRTEAFSDALGSLIDLWTQPTTVAEPVSLADVIPLDSRRNP